MMHQTVTATIDVKGAPPQTSAARSSPPARAPNVSLRRHHHRPYRHHHHSSSSQGIEKLKINLGEGVPPAVGRSFNVRTPMLHHSLSSWPWCPPGSTTVSLPPNLLAHHRPSCRHRTPLKNIMNAGPLAVVVIYTFRETCSSASASPVHHLRQSLPSPSSPSSSYDNMATFAAGGTIPADHYMNMQIVQNLRLIGGSGCTLMLHYRHVPVLPRTRRLAT